MSETRKLNKDGDCPKFESNPNTGFEDLLNLPLNFCKNSGEGREEIEFEMLIEEEQLRWIKTGKINSIDYFLICLECGELSTIIETE